MGARAVHDEHPGDGGARERECGVVEHPGARSLAIKPAMAPPSNYATFYNSLSVAKPVQAGVHYPDLVNIATRYMSKVMANEMSVPAACAAMQKEMTGVLNS